MVSSESDGWAGCRELSSRSSARMAAWCSEMAASRLSMRSVMEANLRLVGVVHTSSMQATPDRVGTRGACETPNCTTRLHHVSHPNVSRPAEHASDKQ